MAKLNLRLIMTLLLLAISINVYAQRQERKFTHADTLRGAITNERAWWDLTYYHLKIRVNPADSSIYGTNLIRYKTLNKYQVMQIDLQPPLKILKITQDNVPLAYKQDGNAYLIQLVKEQNPGDINEVVVEYGGKPHVARNPPWDGGITWKKDTQGSPFIASSCQESGASLWWPCKDHQYDEPDSMLMTITVPDTLMDISNGRLRSTIHNDDKTTTYNWFVSNPISNYCVNINIAKYAHFSEKYKGEKGILDCDYYVLTANLEKAKIQFQEVKRMLEAFEYWFGPYAFYEDSYKLVEAPYLGMEHQSSVTYGNGYANGYLKTDLSRSGWGLKFDFIIVHESAHEWFGNNITCKDNADMWIHEAFAAYAENLFLDYHFGKQASADYVIGTRRSIGNVSPIIGPYNVNRAGSGDMYYKGSNMLHTLRQIINDDEKWRSILRGLTKAFYHKTVGTAEIENYITKESGIDLVPFFNQYLRNAKLAVFEYSIQDNVMKYRWNNVVDGFNMQLKVNINGIDKIIYPTAEWKKMDVETGAKIITDRNYYVITSNLDEKGKK